MPAQPTWFPRLPKILEELEALDCEYLDRHAVETLFGVGQRRARQLMAGLPALQVGNAVAVSRLALLDRFRSTMSGAHFQWESQRRQRVAAALSELRQRAAAARVPLPVAPRSPTLSGGITFHPGELRVRFTSAEDLAAQLLALAQQMGEDWLAFEQRVAKPK